MILKSSFEAAVNSPHRWKLEEVKRDMLTGLSRQINERIVMRSYCVVIGL